ncbi:MAG: acyloxyacyl hydrolase [Candidatus Methylomirabilia bacterium]
MRRWGWVAGIVVSLGTAELALGYDPAGEFTRGTLVVTPHAGGGIINNVEGHERVTTITQVSGTIRVSLLPLDPIGKGFWHGSLETGLEPWFQYYPEQEATAEGLKAAFRYHFLGVSPLFPYVEVLGGGGGSSLNVREVDSDFTFVMEAGAGLSYFVAEGVALTLGYRFQHISNGNVDTPNRGFNSDTGVLGLSFFFH